MKLTLSFLVQSHQELQEKIIERNIPLRTITPRSNPLNMYPQISQIVDQTSFSVTCPFVIEDP